MKTNGTSQLRIHGSSVTRCGLAALVLISLVSGGCVTGALWERFDPDKRVWISCDQVTEEQLREKGLEYETCRLTREQLKEQGIECHEERIEGYLVEKSDLEKLGDWAVLVAATPVTVVADGVIIGAVVVAWCAGSADLAPLLAGVIDCLSD